MSRRIRVTTVGGGTGTFAVLSGLKHSDIELTAIVSVADSGGSTGRLRDEFGFLPVGDLRQSLAALADEDKRHLWIRKLLLYRFSKGNGLAGHNLGNLILTALQDLSGSTPAALEAAGQILRLKGKIFPVTTANVNLVVEYEDGLRVVGQHYTNLPEYGGKKIVSIDLQPKAKIYQKAKVALQNSDYVILGPGDVYGSILPNLVVAGVPEAIKQSSAKVIYVVNLMTRYTQTHNFTAMDHIEAIKKYLGRYPDVAVVNSGKIPQPVLDHYGQEQEYPVVNDLQPSKFRVISAPLNSTATMTQNQADVVARSLLRHDQDKLTKLLKTIMEIN